MIRRVENAAAVWTVGHSTRSPEELLELLRAHRIQALADVRRFPGSRKHPHFNKSELQRSLASAGIDYVHLPQLGGRRRARPDSPNTAWRNAAFRGYADHMLTEEFRAGIEELLGIAAKKRTVIMCAEALWWRCHRALIADYLKSRGVEVFHIVDIDAASAHPYTSAATLRGGKLSYRL